MNFKEIADCIFHARLKTVSEQRYRGNPWDTEATPTRLIATENLELIVLPKYTIHCIKKKEILAAPKLQLDIVTRQLRWCVESLRAQLEEEFIAIAERNMLDRGWWVENLEIKWDYSVSQKAAARQQELVE